MNKVDRVIRNCNDADLGWIKNETVVAFLNYLGTRPRRAPDWLAGHPHGHTVSSSSSYLWDTNGVASGTIIDRLVKNPRPSAFVTVSAATALFIGINDIIENSINFPLSKSERLHKKNCLKKKKKPPPLKIVSSRRPVTNCRPALRD